MAWRDRLYRVLLSLFPSDFRGDFGDEMSADFRDQHRDASRKPRAVARLWAATVIDALHRAPREHFDLLRQDAGHALRVLRRHPAAAATAIASLAVGIGLNSAVYSVVGGVLWRGLPFAESDRLVMVGPVTPSSPNPSWVQTELMLSLESRTRTLDLIAGGTMQSLTVVDPGEPAEMGCLAATPRLFDVLGVRPALGRGFTQADYDAARALPTGPRGSAPTPRVVILSDTVWRTRFGSDPRIIGGRMRVAGGERVEIIGVMGPAIETLGRVLPAGCWLPDTPDAANDTRGPRTLIGRLAEGRSLAEANAELDAIGGQLGEDFFTKEPRRLRAVGILDSIVSGVRTQLLFLFGAVVCVLLVTCANVANLFLAHVAGRRDELAVRAALGASRLRLLRQSLTESLVVALLGGAGGLLLAVLAVPALVELAPANVPRLNEVGIDWSTFLFTLGISTAVGMGCALVAALPARHVPKAVGGAAQLAAPAANRFRRAVAVCEIALALMLAVAATLMVRSVRELNAIDLGFDPRAVVSANLASSVGAGMNAREAHSVIIDRVKGLPGVKEAGIGVGPLSGGMFIGGLRVPGDPREFDPVAVDAVSPGYFEALGARLVAGRFFTRGDMAQDSRDVILLNRSAARLFWRDANPIGRSVIINDTEQLHVIGVVADIRGRILEQEPGPTMYQLSSQSRNFLAGNMMIQVEGDPDALGPAIASVIHSLDRELPFRGVVPLQERIDRAMAPRLFVLRLVGLFSVIGLVLAVIGVYGVLTEFVSQRVPEIGIRMAIGATARDVLRLIFGQGARLVALGLVLGVAGAALLRGVMTTMVYGVETSDPAAYTTAATLLLVATAAACALPARRASRLDPVAALRSE